MCVCRYDFSSVPLPDMLSKISCDGTVTLSVTLSWLNLCIAFTEIWLGDTLIFEKEHRLIFTAVTNIHAGIYMLLHFLL